ncbi:hypothetical protein C0J52_21786 [Blattella germanica]|nr:hypothetical protein C0J52_21786 [Blattella germanica]
MTSKETRKEDVEYLRNWLASQHHLPPVSDKQLELFLHSCKYHLESTKTTIETYYTVKTSAPEFFNSRDPSCQELQQLRDVIQLAPLPKKSPKGYTVIIGRLKDTDPSHFFLNSAIKLLFMIIDACQEAEGPLPGLVYIFDMQGVVFGHMTRVNFASIKKYFLYSQEAMPVRLKAIHILNVNPVISQVMALIRQFVSKERMKMIHLHTGIPDKFLEAIPQDLLPSDYHGKEPTFVELFAKEEFSKNPELKDEDLRKLRYYAEMPVKDPNGCHILFHKLKETEPSKYIFPHALRIFLMMIDACLICEGTSPGVVFLLDAKGVKFGHLMRLSLSLVRRFFIYLQEALPVRLRAIHVLNAAPVIDQLMLIIYFHKGNNETVFKHLPKECLPQDYDGELSSVTDLHDEYVKKLTLLDSYFKEEEKFRSDKSRGTRRKVVGFDPPESALKSLNID